MSSVQALKLEVAQLRKKLEVVRRERDGAYRMVRLLQRHNSEIICAMSSVDIGNQVTASCAVDLPSTSCVVAPPSASCVVAPPSASCVVAPPSASCVDLHPTSCVGDLQSASCADYSRPASCAGVSTNAEPAACLNDDPMTDLPLPSASRQPPVLPRKIAHQNPSRVKEKGWLWFIPEQPADVIILSDSFMRAVDPKSFGRHVDLWSLSGLRTNEAIEILKHWADKKVRCEDIVICVGVNDFYRTDPSVLQEDIRKIKSVALKIGTNVTFCNVPDTLWRTQSRHTRERSMLKRQQLNSAIDAAAKDNRFIAVVDLESLFADHGCPPRNGNEWFHRDALHPNTAGTIAMESCIRQLLLGQKVRAPKDEDRVMRVTAGEFDRRRSLINSNYSRFVTPSRKRPHAD